MVENFNFLNMLSRMKESLNLWECRGLTLAGRIQIFKSLALSFFQKVYGPIVLFTEKFHLEGKTSQIKHTSLIADYVDGGYKDVDIATKLE